MCDTPAPGTDLEPGTSIGQMLVWNGTEWAPFQVPPAPFDGNAMIAEPNGKMSMERQGDFAADVIGINGDTYTGLHMIASGERGPIVLDGSALQIGLDIKGGIAYADEASQPPIRGGFAPSQRFGFGTEGLTTPEKWLVFYDGGGEPYAVPAYRGKVACFLRWWW